MKVNIYLNKRVAVIGAGLTLFRRRLLETPQEIAWEAARKALDEAGLELRDIDCVVIGSAPDAFDGVHMKGEYLSHGSGGIRKPVSRVFVGGATGVMTAIAGWYHVASGLCQRVLAVAEEKMSPSRPHPQAIFKYIWDPILEKPLNPNLIWIFAMEMHRYMATYGIKKEDIALVSVKNKRNALNNPYAQLGANITVEDVLKSEVLVWPVQLLDVSPVSDGAAAIVLASEDVARRYTDTPVWVEGVGWTLDNTEWPARDLAYARYVEFAARMAYKMAGIERPNKEIDVVEPYDPFDYKELHHLEALQLAKRGEAPKLLKEGVFDIDGDIPSSPSGGLLGVGNPIAAAGLMKVVSIYWQLKGTAGKMQVKKPVHTGLAQAWGDLMQAGTVIVMPIEVIRVVTPLKEEELSKHIIISYKPNAKYAYTAGQAQSKYLLGLKEGKIYGRKCNNCGKVYVPPKMYCDECFRPTDEWVEVKDEGIVMTAVASFISWTRARLEEPEIVGVIRLLPSNDRDFVYPGIFHRICTSYEEVKNMSVIGKKVKAVWKPKEERKGSIEDIQCFKVI